MFLKSHWLREIGDSIQTTPTLSSSRGFRDIVRRERVQTPCDFCYYHSVGPTRKGNSWALDLTNV